VRITLSHSRADDIDADINIGFSEFSVFSVRTMTDCSVISVQMIVFCSSKEMDTSIPYFSKLSDIER
jgi:hypothetical protein